MSGTKKKQLTLSKIRRQQALAKEQREVARLLKQLVVTRPEFFKG
jgi:hypothetical protein